jgi:2-polyprenyl-3-methyl-5-hydroxy-6-metoxy-1,4-benzoquinol methylase
MTQNAEHDAVKRHYSVTARTYRDHYDPANLHKSPLYPAEYFRLRNLLERLRAIGCRRVLDAGCGEGTPLIRMAELGCQIRGFDFTPEMVAHARANLKQHGHDPDWVIAADIQDFASFEPLLQDGPFDAVVCFGVMPHVDSDMKALENARRALRSGGRIFVEFRNVLFSLLTLNRYTHGFMLEELLRDAPGELRAATAKHLEGVLAMDKPKPRTSEAGGKPGYDVIRARMHNPLLIGPLLESAGFARPVIHWYHFHPTLPLLEGNGVAPQAFREAAFALEGNPSDWRGHFLCSAFVVEAIAG